MPAKRIKICKGSPIALAAIQVKMSAACGGGCTRTADLLANNAWRCCSSPFARALPSHNTLELACIHAV